MFNKKWILTMTHLPTKYHSKEDNLVVSPEGGKKYDKGKPRYGLLPWRQVDDVVRVLTHGAEKYGDYNWQGVEEQRYKDALGRHISAFMEGEYLDEETGLPHLAHAVCNCLFIMWIHDNKNK